VSCPATLLGFMLLGAAAAPDAGSNSPKSLQPLSFTSRADPDRIRLGEPFSYQLVIRHPPAQRYDLRPPPSDGAFELLSQSRNRVDGRDGATTTFVLKLAMFELGRRRLPDLSFDVVEPDRAGKFVAPGPEVEGISSLSEKESAEGTALRDIKPPEEVPVRSYRLLWALGSLLILAGLAYALYRWLKRERPERPPLQRPLAPLEARIFAALDELREQNLPAQGRAREFYFRLSGIARAYLGERYGFEALECTSAELLRVIRQTQTPGLAPAELARFVDEADLVKFAKAPALPGQCEQSLQFAYQLVKRTLPQSAEKGADLTKVVGASAESNRVDRPRLP
jgi:hypothetical protein